MESQPTRPTQLSPGWALNTAGQSFQRATDQITRAIGFGGPQFEEMARQSSQNVEAMTQANTVLVRGAQDISREWLELAQSRLQRNLDGFNALSRSRSLQEFAAAHTDLVRDNMQQVIDTSRRVADVSVRVASEAARTVVDRRAPEAVAHQKVSRFLQQTGSNPAQLRLGRVLAVLRTRKTGLAYRVRTSLPPPRTADPALSRSEWSLKQSRGKQPQSGKAGAQ
jgi:phasin family protein